MVDMVKEEVKLLRSAITLSCITKKPIHLENIRKNQKSCRIKATTFDSYKNSSKNFKCRNKWE